MARLYRRFARRGDLYAARCSDDALPVSPGSLCHDRFSGKSVFLKPVPCTGNLEIKATLLNAAGTFICSMPNSFPRVTAWAWRQRPLHQEPQIMMRNLADCLQE